MRIVSFILIVLVICPIPANASETYSGYSLFYDLKGIENPKTTEEAQRGLIALGFINGVLEGIVATQDTFFIQLFRKDNLTENELILLSAELGVYKIDIPTSGIPTGQLIMIYNKWAENNPKNLHMSAKVAVMFSLIDAFGWKGKNR